jgi:hypothetical protein
MGKQIVAVNGGDRGWTTQRFVLAFGDFSPTYLMVWGNGIGDALDEAVDWLADNAPGLLCDDAVASAYRDAVAEGKGEEEAQAEAEVDTTCAGNAGHYLRIDHWTIALDNPTREEILAFQAN